MGKLSWHVLLWLIYINLNYAINRLFIKDIRFLDNLLGCLVVIVFFYSFVGILLMIYRKKSRVYGILLLLISFLILYYFSYAYIYQVLPSLGVNIFEAGLSFDQKEFLQNFYLTVLRTFIYAFLYFLGLRFIDISRKRERDLNEKLLMSEERNRYHSKFLTSQIFPHFLKNTLQTLGGKVLIRRDVESSNIIYSLSDLLAYTAHQANSDDDLVYLRKELRNLESLIGLVRQQHANPAVVLWTKEGAVAGEKIPPMILLTFVENVFKYGQISEEHPLLIHTVFDKQGFGFFCQNRKKTNSIDSSSTKIGLVNVRQRLEMHLPGMHELSVDNECHYFKVDLKIGNVK